MKKLTRVCITIVALGALSFGGVTSAVAAPAAGESSEQSVEIRMGKTLEDSTLIGIENDPVMSTDLFDPSDSLFCDGANDPNHVVETHYTYGFPLLSAGNVDLFCGTNTSMGFKHIRARHQWNPPGYTGSWEGVRAAATAALGYTAPLTWDDYMWDAVKVTLDIPITPPYATGPGKLCFTSDYYIWKGSEKAAAFYVNTIVSQNNRLVITAYPSDNFGPSCARNGS